MLKAACLLLFLPSGYPGAVAHQAGLEGMKLIWAGGLDRVEQRVPGRNSLLRDGFQ